MNSIRLKPVAIAFAICFFGLANVSQAQDWARKMFKEYVHEFGKVTLGDIPEYRFEVENVYNEDIVIRSVTSSCGCTIATPSKNLLKTWEKGEIICRFNTPAVGNGFKQATVTVRFEFKAANAKPLIGECQLTVNGTIVSGLNFSPDKIDFGQVTEKNFPVKKISLSHTGNPNFRVQDVKSTFGHIKVQIKETARRGNYVNYEMTAQLTDSVPKGYTQGDLYVVVEENPYLRNRDGSRVLKEVPIKFNAKVVAPLRVAPEILTLGSIAPGEIVTQKVFLTCDQAFKITDVRCLSEAFRVRADKEAKKIHIVEVTYTGENEPGRHECELSFYTDLDQDASGKLKAIVEIVSK
jgi:hypothetical protein